MFGLASVAAMPIAGFLVGGSLLVDASGILLVERRFCLISLKKGVSMLFLLV